ncbi:hypothetical protein [Streptomonospora alba]|uniref:hypothetical protein n=1 Tax=Streptomonospora alba TaxID=183763 RepID=UPI000AE6E73D|nr:hypothetical protein [Streptomonospora alba]
MGLSRPHGAVPPRIVAENAGRDGLTAPRPEPRGGAGPGGAGSWVRRGRGALRAAVLDAAALGGRLAAGWIAASWAWEALGNGTRADLAAGAVLVCAAAFAAGLASRPAGAALAAAVLLSVSAPGALAAVGLEAEPTALTAAGASTPWRVALGAVCLLGALLPGRLSVDALLVRRRGRRRSARRGEHGAGADRTRIGRRPEEAPPLPYPGGRDRFTRPSRI